MIKRWLVDPQEEEKGNHFRHHDASLTQPKSSFTCVKEGIQHQAGVHGINMRATAPHHLGGIKHGTLFSTIIFLTLGFGTVHAGPGYLVGWVVTILRLCCCVSFQLLCDIYHSARSLSFCFPAFCIESASYIVVQMVFL